MSIILLETHHKLVRKVRKRAFIIHGILVLMLLASVLFPWISKIETDLIRASYGVVRLHLVNMESRHTLLKILRNKPLTVGQALDIADAIFLQRDIKPSLILAIMDVESSFNPDAVSKKGAKGLLQVMPMIAQTYSGNLSKNIHDPIINIHASVQYLVDLRKIYKDDWTKILRVYNGGPSNVNNRAIDGYVKAVMTKWKEYERDKIM